MKGGENPNFSQAERMKKQSDGTKSLSTFASAASETTDGCGQFTGSPSDGEKTKVESVTPLSKTEGPLNTS